MGAKYTTISSSGYNSSPPPDDGTQVAANLVAWSTHKTKLTDPLKTEIDSINTALVAAFDYSVRQITSSDSTVAGDHMRCVEIAPTATIAVTVSLGDAATMTTTYRVFVRNSSAINQTVGRVTSGDTIDGVAANVTLAPGEARLFQTNSTPNGYLTVGRTTVYVHGADVASATTTNLDTATGDLVDVTGTTTITAITLANGQERTVRFTGILILTHGASLVLPTAANITTAAGDFAIFRGYASGVVRCAVYSRASGVALAATAVTLPTQQRFASGSGTYTTPASVRQIKFRLMAGGGGGAGGAGAGSSAGGNGGDTTFSTFTAGGGLGGTVGSAGGAGGTASGSPNIGLSGGKGGGADGTTGDGGDGGASAFGGNGGGGQVAAAGTAGATNTGGGGGGGGGSSAPAASGGGGGGGAYVEHFINSPAATYSYGVGAAGTAGAAGATTGAGAAGGSGYIIVDEYY